MPVDTNVARLPADWTPLSSGVAEAEEVTCTQQGPEVATATVNLVRSTV